MGKEFLELFAQIEVAIDGIFDIIARINNRYVEASTRASASERRLVEAEERIAAIDGELSVQKQETAVMAAKYAGAIEVLGKTEEEKQEARDAAQKASESAVAAQTSLVQSQQQAAEAKRLYEQYVAEAEALDKEQDSEREAVLNQLNTVKDALQGLSEKAKESEKAEGKGYGFEANA